MLRLSQGQRAFLSDKFGDLANLAALAMVLDQALGSELFSSGAALAGIGVWLLLMIVGFVLMGGNR